MNKWCTQCRVTQPARGGIYRIINKGRNKRWLCAGCYANAQAKGLM